MAKSEDSQFNSVEEAIADIKNNKIVIVLDSIKRENEGDFICAAANVTPQMINFMVTHARGGCWCLLWTWQVCGISDPSWRICRGIGGW